MNINLIQSLREVSIEAHRGLKHNNAVFTQHLTKLLLEAENGRYNKSISDKEINKGCAR